MMMLAEDRARLRTQLRREIDQVVFDDPLSIERSRPGGNGCVGHVRSPSSVDAGHRPLLDRPDRLAGFAIEDESRNPAS